MSKPAASFPVAGLLCSMGATCERSASKGRATCRLYVSDHQQKNESVDHEKRLEYDVLDFTSLQLGDESRGDNLSDGPNGGSEWVDG